MPGAATASSTSLRLGVRAGDGVAGEDAVVEGRLEGLLRHRVDDAGDGELGDVERVGEARVLDAGRGPERTLPLAPAASRALARSVANACSNTW